ncbi:hypothetical protein C8R43DRAFT_1017064 [Mycena crocata]|nr:hypothetical protein C8R43DRAFT_1017064 [Mycena crocata]
MESPFARYLYTSYVPSDSEVEHIKRHLEAPFSEVSRLESLIRDLSAQREKLVEYISAHEALISPMRRLPQDVVQEIFVACLPTHRNAVMSAREAPLLLARVCSAWRTLAMTTPALWATLHIPLEYILDWGVTGPMAEWLERSGKRPLSLSIKGSRNMEHWEDCDADTVETAMGALIRSSARWHTLDLAFLSGEGLLHLGDVYAPRLVAVTMKCEPTEVRQMKLLSTPSLRSVDLKIWQNFDRFVPEMPLRWESLASLTIDSMGAYLHQGLTPPMAVQILQHCRRLVHFESDISNSLEQEVTPLLSQPHVVLSELRELIICRCSSSVGPISILYILDHLVMPNLRHLQLPRTAEAFINSPPSPFLGNLATNSPLIEELSIDLTRLLRDSLIQTLSMLLNLKKLIVLDARSGHNFSAVHTAATVQHLLTALVPDSDVLPLCPLLRELQLMELRDPLDSEGRMLDGEAVLLDFARRRLDATGSQFSRLEVEFQMFMPMIRPEVLAPFATRGLIIVASSPQPMGRPRSPDTAWTGLDN